MAAAVVALGFLITLEIASRHYGMPGPITNQAQEVVFAPKSGPLLYAGMALMTVVLTWRQRFVSVGVAIGVRAARPASHRARSSPSAVGAATGPVRWPLRR